MAEPILQNFNLVGEISDEINHIDRKRLEHLIETCNYYDIEFMTSIFHEEALDLTRGLELKRYKIASITS